MQCLLLDSCSTFNKLIFYYCLLLCLVILLISWCCCGPNIWRPRPRESVGRDSLDWKIWIRPTKLHWKYNLSFVRHSCNQSDCLIECWNIFSPPSLSPSVVFTMHSGIYWQNWHHHPTLTVTVSLVLVFQLFFLEKMTLLSAVPVDPNTFDNSSSSVDSLLIGSSSPVKCEDQTPERWDKATMVRETVKVTFICTYNAVYESRFVQCLHIIYLKLIFIWLNFQGIHTEVTSSKQSEECCSTEVWWRWCFWWDSRVEESSQHCQAWFTAGESEEQEVWEECWQAQEKTWERSSNKRYLKNGIKQLLKSLYPYRSTFSDDQGCWSQGWC